MRCTLPCYAPTRRGLSVCPAVSFKQRILSPGLLWNTNRKPHTGLWSQSQWLAVAKTDGDMFVSSFFFHLLSPSSLFLISSLFRFFLFMFPLPLYSPSSLPVYSHFGMSGYGHVVGCNALASRSFIWLLAVDWSDCTLNCRVKSAVSLYDEFGNVFNCPDDSNMHPRHACLIWWLCCYCCWCRSWWWWYWWIDSYDVDHGRSLVFRFAGG